MDICLIWFYVMATQFKLYVEVPTFTGGGRPPVPLHTLFQAQTVT
jgi:hypothetical protein